MGAAVVGVSPRVLRWARETAGMRVETVAAGLKRAQQEIEAWESGTAAPTFPQLEALAGKYRRPVALFFFPEPPDEQSPEKAFRTLPEFEFQQLQPDTLYRIREGRALQVSLSELTGGVNPAARKILNLVRISPTQDVERAATEVRRHLGIEIDTLRQSATSFDDALAAWRRAVEGCGVFVFKNAFQQASLSGFCLADDEFPIIYVNNSTTKTRQMFTLLHELGHLLLGTGGITKEDDSFIEALRGADKRVEVFCNAFAAECVFPNRTFRERSRGLPATPATFAKLAREFWVSREVVARRFVDDNRLSSAEYRRYAAMIAREHEAARLLRKQKGRETGGGGNYYLTQIAYYGDTFLRLAFSRHYGGSLSRDDLAGLLRMKTKSLAGLEDRLLARVDA